jgi:Zn-dependent peptidase ImmA (M78 family)
MSKIPSKIKIGWKDVDIDIIKTSFIKETTDYWGQYNNRTNKIEIQEEAPDIDKANTLLHEVLHAILYHSSLNQPGGPLREDEAEEQAVNSISNWLMGVFTDNPWFLDYLKDTIHGNKKSK